MQNPEIAKKIGMPLNESHMMWTHNCSNHGPAKVYGAAVIAWPKVMKTANRPRRKSSDQKRTAGVDEGTEESIPTRAVGVACQSRLRDGEMDGVSCDGSRTTAGPP